MPSSLGGWGEEDNGDSSTASLAAQVPEAYVGRRLRQRWKKSFLCRSKKGNYFWSQERPWDTFLFPQVLRSSKGILFTLSVQGAT